MARPEKVAVVKEVKEKIEKAQTMVLTEFSRLGVQDMQELRRSLSSQGIEYKVYKNTLVKRAVDSLDLQELDGLLSGPTGMAFSYDDPVSVAKVLLGFSKKNEGLQVKGGLVEGKVVAAADVKALASLPSREELFGQMVGSLASPISGLVRVLTGPTRGLVVALGAVAEQKS